MFDEFGPAEFKKFQQLMDALPSGVTVLDENYKIIFRNELVIKESELPPEFWAIGTDISELLKLGIDHHVYPEFDDVESLISYIKHQVDNYGSVNTFRHQPNGRIISESFRRAEFGGFIGTYTDVTEIKMREYELANITERLKEKTLASETANEAKSNFLATMSHEIRTPMNGVLGMAQILQKTELTPRQRSFVDTICRSGEALVTIINDVLDFSKIESGQLELEDAPFNLKSVLNEVGDLLGVTAREKNIEFVTYYDPALPSHVIGDSARIRQILVNLIGNAIKFTTSGSVLAEITGKQKPCGNVALKILVRDTGIGIPKEKVELIFDRFSQVDNSATRQFGGSGLGLSIVKKLAGLMGGYISVMSELEKGSDFIVELELKTNQSSENKTNDTLHWDGIPVLIIDDNPVNRRVLKEYTEFLGGTPLVINSAEGALQILKRAKAKNFVIPVILCDYLMPGMSGIEFCEMLKGDPFMARSKVIVVSAADGVDWHRHFLDLGIEDFLQKPVRLSQLSEAINSAISRRPVQTFETLEEAVELPVAAAAPESAAMPEPEIFPETMVLSDTPLDAERAEVENVIPEEQIPDKETADIALPAGPVSGKFQILIAEDNLNNRMVIENMLFIDEYELTFAEDGRQAIDHFKSKKFDLVLMDISMPVLDGELATLEIRSFEKEQNRDPTPIIALTAHALIEDRNRFLQNGMDDYLSKPLKMKLVRDIVAKHLQGDKSTDIQDFAA